MNKKILSIFVMVMALSLLGVSCNNKNTTGSTDENGGGGSTTTQITDAQIQTALRTALGTIKVNNTSSVTVDANTGVYASGTFTITKTGAGNDGVNTDAASSVNAVLATLKQKLDEIGITCNASSVTFSSSTPATNSSCTLDITVKDGYALPDGTADTITITISLTSQNWS